MDAGGLYVIGTERHESRRIDNQLRGRSGRQGDPGQSQFFVALDDEIMRLFGGDTISGLMTRFNMPENVPLQHPLVSRAIEQAQIKVEGYNFDIRKHLVEYDDVLNKQREIIYARRRKALETRQTSDDLKQEILEKIHSSIAAIVAMYSAKLCRKVLRLSKLSKNLQPLFLLMKFPSNKSCSIRANHFNGRKN